MGIPIIYHDPIRGLFLLFREPPTTRGPRSGIRVYAILSMNSSSWEASMVAEVDCENNSPESEGMPRFRIRRSETFFVSEAIAKWHEDQPYAFLRELIMHPSAIADLASTLQGEATEAEILLDD